MPPGDASLNRCGGTHCYCQGLIVTRAGFRRRLPLSADYQTDFALLVLQYRIEPRRKFRYAEPALIFRRTPTFVILSAGMPIKEPGLTWTNKNQLRGPLIRPSGQGLQRGRAGSREVDHDAHLDIAFSERVSRACVRSSARRLGRQGHFRAGQVHCASAEWARVLRVYGIRGLASDRDQ